MDELPDIDSEIEELHRRLQQDIDDHLNNRAGLSTNQHFELWDRMWELENQKRRLVHH